VAPITPSRTMGSRCVLIVIGCLRHVSKGYVLELGEDSAANRYAFYRRVALRAAGYYNGNEFLPNDMPKLLISQPNPGELDPLNMATIMRLGPVTLRLIIPEDKHKEGCAHMAEVVGLAWREWYDENR
jgi:hypothetical protein